MSAKPYFFLSATVFALVAIAHLSRLATGWPMIMGSFNVPHWLSIPGVAFPGALSFWGFRLARRTS